MADDLTEAGKRNLSEPLNHEALYAAVWPALGAEIHHYATSTSADRADTVQLLLEHLEEHGPKTADEAIECALVWLSWADCDAELDAMPDDAKARIEEPLDAMPDYRRAGVLAAVIAEMPAPHAFVPDMRDSLRQTILSMEGGCD